MKHKEYSEGERKNYEEEHKEGDRLDQEDCFQQRR